MGVISVQYTSEKEAIDAMQLCGSNFSILEFTGLLCRESTLTINFSAEKCCNAMCDDLVHLGIVDPRLHEMEIRYA